MKTSIFKLIIPSLLLGSLNAYALISSGDDDSTKGNAWEVTQMEPFGKVGTFLTFSREKKNGLPAAKYRVLDDDGLLMLSTIQFNLMQPISEAIATNKTTWAAVADTELKDYPKFQPTIVASLQRLIQYSGKERDSMLGESARIKYTLDFAYSKTPLSTEEQATATKLNKRLAELINLQNILTADMDHAQHLMEFFQKNPRMTAQGLSVSLGQYLSLAAPLHDYEVQSPDGSVESVALFNSNPSKTGQPKHPLTQAFTSRPFAIEDDNIISGSMDANINFASSLFNERPDSSESPEEAPKPKQRRQHTETPGSELVIR